MSDPKLISPLLDGFALGNPLSSHDGVSCCPAIKENSDKKYIVKIITIPATQTQMDALLLAGAYRDPADAMEYYRVIGEEVMKEAELLTTLSKLDGFLPYEGWQMEPITKRRLGYEVYLVGSYKRSLDKYVRRNPVTHLEAVNLALDMCSALAVCRQAGSLYVDLKPTNIFMSEKKEYRIGDLGFISLDAMSYTVLPDKYRSQYTPPELHDPMTPMNLTVDTYAVGMILYQLYNDGQLPFQEKAPEEPLPTPMNADYELAEIIMKAINPDPKLRWKSPQEMGKALVSYMQRNAVNDVPITPHTPLEVMPEPVVLPQEKQAQEAPSVKAPDDTAAPAEPGHEESVSALSEPVTDAAIVEDETVPSEEDAATLLPHEMSDELSRIIAHADDLLDHEIPEAVLVPEKPAQEDPFDFIAVNPEDVDDSDIPLDPVMEDPVAKPTVKEKVGAKFSSGKTKQVLKKVLSLIAILVILGGIGIGLFWGYENYYLQTIEALTITGDRSQLSVSVETDTDESLLRVICSDNYGNTVTEELVNGSAVFTNLLPDTMYKIEVVIDGFHKLAGETSNVFTTDATTDIVGFTAVTGSEDGSVILSFTPDGDEPAMWTLVYSAEGEEEQRKNFDGHTVNISGLSIGKRYTFTLEAENISLSGETSLDYMASRLILAQNLTVDSSTETEVSVSWNAPGDIVVDSWLVRCYNGNNYDEQFIVTDTEAYFIGMDPTSAYHIEVTAAGMTQSVRSTISSNPISITDLKVDESDPNVLNITWDYTGNEPAGGWLLMYSIDGGEANKSVVKCENASAMIRPKIPDADYQFTIQTADSTTVFGSNHSYSTADSETFSGNDLSADEITGFLVKTPEEEDWLFDDLGSGSVTDSFAIGDPISIVLQASGNFYLPNSNMEVMFVIRDAHDNVVSELVGTTQTTWRNLWFSGDHKYGELDLPKVPGYAGSYSVTVYFDGDFVVTIPFTIAQ